VRGFGCLLSRFLEWVVGLYAGIDLLRGGFSMLDGHFRGRAAVVLHVKAVRAAMMSIEV